MHLGARGPAQHAAFLENVAEGMCDDPASGALGRLPPGGGVLTLPDSMLCVDSELSGWVYDGSEQTVRAADFASESYYAFWTARAILAPHRATVATCNGDVMERLFPDVEELLSSDTVCDAGDDGKDPGTGYGEEELNGLWPGGMPPHKLGVCAGMPVMCTMNLPHLGVFNGSRLIVLKVHKSSTTGAPLFVICSVWREGDLSGREVVIPRAKVVSKSDDVPFGWVRQQFPLQLCFAMTINKAQGQTLRSRVGVVLTSPVWTHGQTYVALGRVTDPANLRVATPANGTAVVNVVYKDVLAVGEARGV